VRLPSKSLLKRRIAFLLFLVALLACQPAIAQAPQNLVGSLKFEQIGRGIEYTRKTVGSASANDATGPWFINAVRIDLTQARLKIVHALDEGIGLETVSSLATRYRATAATNGGYFSVNGSYRGDSVGLLVLDGKLISEPYKNRVAFGLIEVNGRNDIVFGHLKFSGQLTLRNGKRQVQGLNRQLLADELVIFTPEFHRTTLTGPNVLEVIVRKNKVTSIRDLQGDSNIPADGFVVAATGTTRDWLKTRVKPGSPLSFSWRLDPFEPEDSPKWRRARNILGAGPQLIRNGRIAIASAQEQISDSFIKTGHPRTAIARLADGKVLLLTVDGRQPHESIGMSLTTLGDVLLELGAVDAMNLDGGGSTTMVIHNKVVNRPSDATGERPVSDAILVFPKKRLD
jgi:exopolysaccharide biosynthesis protein